MHGPFIRFGRGQLPEARALSAHRPPDRADEACGRLLRETGAVLADQRRRAVGEGQRRDCGDSREVEHTVVLKAS